MQHATPSIPATYDELKTAYLDVLCKYEQLQVEVAWMKRQMFGQKSEHFVPLNNGQLALGLGDMQSPAATPKTEHITYDRSVPQKEKNGHGRSPLPSHLPRVDVVIEPKGDMAGLKKIGEDITEELECDPGKFFVRRFIRPKYAKPDGESGPTIIMGELPYRPIEKGRPGPGLLAHVSISKYVDHLPLYRQEQMFKRMGVFIPRSTLCGWVQGCYELLLPVYERLIQKIIATDYIQADETPIRVQDENEKGRTHRGYFFVYHAPLIPAVAFVYEEGRGRIGPEEFLKDFSGYLQRDAYAGYNRLVSMPRITGVGCMAHCRRPFFEATDNDPVRADEALRLIGALYTVEDAAREHKLAPLDRYALRQEKAVPVMGSFKAWLDENVNAVLPKSPIGKAISYALNIWESLQTYLTDGRLEIDNNLVENAIRPVALGRKNWLFAGSHEGAKRAALLYSLVCACKMNGMEPFGYLRNLLDKLPGHPQSRIDELLPLAAAPP